MIAMLLSLQERAPSEWFQAFFVCEFLEIKIPPGDGTEALGIDAPLHGTKARGDNTHCVKKIAL
jgi:hypothetical protein